MNLVEMLFVVWVSVSLIAGFWFLGYMFYHWGIHKFLSNKIKIVWFWVLFLGLPLYLCGPLIYYIFVFEMKKGLRFENTLDNLNYFLIIKEYDKT